MVFVKKSDKKRKRSAGFDFITAHTVRPNKSMDITLKEETLNVMMILDTLSPRERRKK